MASYVTPKKNTAWIGYIGLTDQSNTKLLKAAPTIAAGDFKISKDGGAFANLTNLPTVTPSGGTAVQLSLTSTEMNADNIVIACIDAAGAEWCDQLLNIQTSARQIDDLAFPITSGNGINVDSNGRVKQQSGFSRNVAFLNFTFLMTDSTAHNPAPGKTVTVTRSIDGGAFGGGTLSAVTEMSNGSYRVDFAAADMNGAVILFRATASGCDDLFIAISTDA